MRVSGVGGPQFSNSGGNVDPNLQAALSKLKNNPSWDGLNALEDVGVTGKCAPKMVSKLLSSDFIKALQGALSAFANSSDSTSRPFKNLAPFFEKYEDSNGQTLAQAATSSNPKGDLAQWFSDMENKIHNSSGTNTFNDFYIAVNLYIKGH